MRERLVVQESAASLLNRPSLQVLLAALIDQDCTMSDLVGRCGMSYSLLSHHVQRLAGQGLVREVGRVPRAGRACRLYRAVARRYFIPAALCKSLPGEQLARTLRGALQTACKPKGLLLSCDGGPRMQLVLDNPSADTSELWMHLRLSPAAAREFNAALRALFEHWHGLSGAKGAVFLAHGACVRAA